MFCSLVGQCKKGGPITWGIQAPPIRKLIPLSPLSEVLQLRGNGDFLAIFFLATKCVQGKDYRNTFVSDAITQYKIIFLGISFYLYSHGEIERLLMLLVMSSADFPLLTLISTFTRGGNAASSVDGHPLLDSRETSDSSPLSICSSLPEIWELRLKHSNVEKTCEWNQAGHCEETLMFML